MSDMDADTKDNPVKRPSGEIHGQKIKHGLKVTIPNKVDNLENLNVVTIFYLHSSISLRRILVRG